MTNTMASSGLWKMIYLPIFILTTDGTIGCTMSDTWCQMVWHLIADTVLHTYQILWGIVTNCEPPAHHEGLWTMYSEWLEMWKALFKLEGRGVEQDNIPYVGQLKLPKVSVDGWIIDLTYRTSLMGLVMLCDFLPTTEKLSTLVRWPVVFARSRMGGRSPEMFLKLPQRSL